MNEIITAEYLMRTREVKLAPCHTIDACMGVRAELNVL
jgi:hypothetical protein